MVFFKGIMYVPNQKNIKDLILDEYHIILYAGHLGYHKLITALRKEYLWLGIKKEVAEYLVNCLEYQQVKTEHCHLARFLHLLHIPKWKWKTISIDFIMGLPKSKRKSDLIKVVVNKLSKFAHFIQVQSTYKVVQISNIFMQIVLDYMDY